MRLVQSVMEASLALWLAVQAGAQSVSQPPTPQGVSYRVLVGDVGSVCPNRAESESFNRAVLPRLNALVSQPQRYTRNMPSTPTRLPQA
jgi:hypothetical protein